ncbi:amino acid permease 3 isoform X1 [Physcomitrium patens]|uniref:Amino acid transporter transmembrane domain-containing protein n=1 Tax=Physcomitrium patens TaxID=3218 RepID=A9SR84_PHYPA|nr:amino acid permease 3-like isoform X1 [Physcomitrium patens]XP_024392331.1 amino acid permease 3-like isoform X1 [Physcomitrium patens]XP_024392332.1 amino acid permease 3-like isoform X1 [Physcomitrium patens]XP_024392333.1 amino acid permease 3-like isoform X1 [Physcomitrium patens]XP_024392335.1 amino acid permease 3-like isoform X1 [Physcomitrium patens]XP_024392336.1 amino acid permease 3-like isoform X1 [Physcomitrium patens]|eukprot:XP_024392330.1 amino acid permease 3-like isoform X1 [Physcomitrella patens]
MDGDHVILGLTGNAKLGQTDDNALGHGEKGRAGFDGVDKPIHDPNLNDDDGKPRRKGTVITSAAHIITAVIGSGVLALSWSFAQMGWIAGPIVLLAFAWCTYYTSRLLADCYRSPDPIHGKRNYIYMDAIKANLGRKQQLVCACVQYSNLIGTSIGYTIATATSAKAIQYQNCIHDNGPDDPCLTSTTVYIAIFGVIQIVLSQIPNFGELWWLSYLAAAMSFTYSFIGLGLGISKAATGENSHGSLGGTSVCYPSNGETCFTRPQKTWNVFTALGNMAFAYSFSMILIEIQDTIKSPPSESSQMKKATLLGIITTTFFYMSVAIAGYAAFGDAAPGNLLTGFSTPYWLVDFANTCIVIHLIGAYQVYTQPVYAFVERWCSLRWPNNSFLNLEYNVRLPGRRNFRVSAFRLIWRTIYVIITTIISMLIPFFNSVLGILGAIGFWPLTVYYPVEMYIRQTHVQRWSRKFLLLQLLSFVTLLISIAGLIGGVSGIIQELQHVALFAKT